jgi:N-acetylglucosaminyldiphosphoundecaprenol N-acetyl-beta-D-mannosaminyltransferase
MQRSGLEWLWRIKEEPSLLSRYWNDGLALCTLMGLRVLPLALSTRWHRATSKVSGQACRVQLTQLADGAQLVTLTGHAESSGLAAVRSTWEACWRGSGDIRIDLSQVPWFDATFVALCLLLETALRDQGRRFALQGICGRHRRLFTLHQCAHLLAA